jgi:peptide methionine sulfoxide reductase MsrB
MLPQSYVCRNGWILRYKYVLREGCTTTICIIQQQQQANDMNDSVSGLPLFRAPIGRTVDDFIAESKVHGWPSFRDDEVVWDNVRILKNGETVSIAGTHLGHDIPDGKGNRYCINLVSVAGNPA